MFFKCNLWAAFLNEPMFIFFSQLNGFTYFYLIRMLLLGIELISCLHTVNCLQAFSSNTYNSI